MVAWKSCFSDWLSFSSTLNKVKCLKTRAFLTIFKDPEEKMLPPLKSVLKVGKIMWTLIYILSLKKMFWRLEEKKIKKTRIIIIFSCCRYIYSERKKTQFWAHNIFPTFKTDLRMWYPFVSWGLQKWQKKMRKMFDNNSFWHPA